MEAILWVLVGTVLGVLLLLRAVLLWGRWWRRRLCTPDFFESGATVRTGDGQTIFLGRFLPQGEPSALPPVVLCHGLAMNRRTFALEPGEGLAQRLAAAGRDVWVLELRGAHPDANDPSLRSSTFDHYARWDLPAAIAHVRDATGAREVDWVGFSMGGMLAYAHLGSLKAGSIRRLVTVGSPQHFRDLHPSHALGRRLLPLYGKRPRAPLGTLCAAVAPLLRTWFPYTLTAGLRADHYSPRGLPRALAGAMADVPMGVMVQFDRWVTEDSLTSEDGVHDYRKGLALIDVPTLLLAADRDALAPPSSVTFAYEHLGAREKELLVVGGEAHGQSFDHLDLVLGRFAPEAVFPHIERWLRQGP